MHEGVIITSSSSWWSSSSSSSSSSASSSAASSSSSSSSSSSPNQPFPPTSFTQPLLWAWRPKARGPAECRRLLNYHTPCHPVVSGSLSVPSVQVGSAEPRTVATSPWLHRSSPRLWRGRMWLLPLVPLARHLKLNLQVLSEAATANRNGKHDKTCPKIELSGHMRFACHDIKLQPQKSQKCNMETTQRAVVKRILQV